jgi:hypothetical protein
MQVIQFDWSTADVHDGRLTVSLDNKPSKGWIQSFETAARLLNNGHFADLRLRRSSVRIEPIVPGEEDAARHFLESLAQEANAHVGADEAQSEPDSEAATEDSSDEDGAMTERFRAFAPGE